MPFRLTLFFLILFFCSCKPKEDSGIHGEAFVEPNLSPIYFNPVCQGDSCSYVHYLMLSNFDDTKFNNYNFIYLADKYLDSVGSHLPVASVQFCKPFTFKDIGGSENDEQLKQNAIAAIWYNLEGKQDEVPEISSISIWTNGVRKDVEYMDLKSRRRGMQHLNSKE